MEMLKERIRIREKKNRRIPYRLRVTCEFETRGVMSINKKLALNSFYQILKLEQKCLDRGEMFLKKFLFTKYTEWQLSKS